LYPADDFGSQPLDVDTGIVASCCLALGIGCSTDINDVDESVGVSQIIQEAVSETLAHMRSRHQTSYVEQFDRYGAGSIVTHAIVWFTSFDEGFVANIGNSGS